MVFASPVRVILYPPFGGYACPRIVEAIPHRLGGRQHFLREDQTPECPLRRRLEQLVAEGSLDGYEVDARCRRRVVVDTEVAAPVPRPECGGVVDVPEVENVTGLGYGRRPRRFRVRVVTNEDTPLARKVSSPAGPARPGQSESPSWIWAMEVVSADT